MQCDRASVGEGCLSPCRCKFFAASLKGWSRLVSPGTPLQRFPDKRRISGTGRLWRSSHTAYTTVILAQDPVKENYTSGCCTTYCRSVATNPASRIDQAQPASSGQGSEPRTVANIAILSSFKTDFTKPRSKARTPTMQNS